MDLLDKRILEILQRNSNESVADIAEAVGLSTTPCWRRIRRMEEAGVIARRVAILSPGALGLKLVAFVSVKAARHDEGWLERFSAVSDQFPEVVELHRMSGEFDYLMKIVCPDMEAFDGIYRRLIAAAPFSDVTSTFSMERLKDTTQLPLTYA